MGGSERNISAKDKIDQTLVREAHSNAPGVSAEEIFDVARVRPDKQIVFMYQQIVFTLVHENTLDSP